MLTRAGPTLSGLAPSDEATAGRVAAHLDDCERCGMEADVYRDIKAALARRPVTGVLG